MQIIKPINIIICGVGGQGINTLNRKLVSTAQANGFICKSKVFKGGAQTLGTVYSMIRIFPKDEKYENYSAEIPKTEADVVFAFEPWEALRFVSFYSQKTHLLVNSKQVPLNHMIDSENLDVQFKKLASFDLNLYFDSYEEQCSKPDAEYKYMNMYMLKIALDKAILPPEFKEALG